MIIKFKDGTTKSCSNPKEQKIFKSGEAAGWLCGFVITDAMNSSDVDAVLTVDNISSLEFCTDEGVKVLDASGYSRVTFAVIRCNEHSCSVEIQLTKGV